MGTSTGDQISAATASASASRPSARPAQPPRPPDGQHDDRREQRQERRKDHLGQRGHGEEEAGQRRVLRPRLAQRFQQVERVERQPLGGDHVVVAQRGVYRPVRREGVDEAGEERGEAKNVMRDT